MLRFNGSILPTKGEKRNAGFSLVELMVVVAIIGILAALAIGRFGNMTRNARRAEAFGNLNQIRTLSEVWGQENNFGYTGATYTLANIGFTAPGAAQARFEYELGTTSSAGTGAEALVGINGFTAQVDGAGGWRANAKSVVGRICDAGAVTEMAVAATGAAAGVTGPGGLPAQVVQMIRACT